MRVFIGFILSLLVTLFVAGCNTHKSTNAKAPDYTPSMRVVVNSGKIEIDDQTIELPCSVESLTTLFGDPSRKLSLANVIHVWDKAGVLAYQSPDQQSVNTLTFVFDRFDAEHWPKHFFPGQLSVDGRTFSKSTTKAELTAAGYDNYGVILWFRQTGEVGVDIHTNNTNVVAVSFAPQS